MFYSGNMKQTSKDLTYDTEQSCICGSCNIFSTRVKCQKTNNVDDWSYGYQICCGGFCPQKSLCAKPDPKQCQIGLNENQINPFDRVTWNEKAPNITCFYSMNQMNSFSVIKEYYAKFGNTADYNSMMVNFCSEPGKECAIDPKTGAPLTQCNRLNSVDEEGQYCRQWFNNQSLGVQDTIVTNYCLKYPTSPDCKCINRQTDKSYNTVKKFSPFNDGCWYSPCVTDTYLVTSNLREPTCPTNICQTVLDNLENNNVTIKDIQNEINCSFKDPSPPSPFPPSPIGPQPPTESSNLLIVMVIFGISIVFVFFLFSRNRS